MNRLLRFCEHLLTTHRSRRRSEARSVQLKLHLEEFESRFTPASYTWDGSANGFWSDESNWIDDSTGNPATTAPGANDSVTFDGDRTITPQRLILAQLRI